MKNKVIKFCFGLFFFTFFSITNFVFADDLPIPQSIDVLLRSGDSVLYEDSFTLPDEGNIDIADNAGATHSVNARSVLGVLYAIDQLSDNFLISDITYYSSFNSLYLKCITPVGKTPLCDDWQYVVNSFTPGTGMDSTILTGNEKVGIYFGANHKIEINKTSITTEESVTVTTQKYNYLDNSWGILSGVTVGITQPNPEDPYSPIVVVSKVVGEDGKATFSSLAKGSYSIGISEDFYFPSYSLEVTEPVVVPPSGGGGGGGGSILFYMTHKKMDVPKAIQFLASKQYPDGSFGSELYTDWVAIGLAKVPEVNMDQLKNYLLSNDLGEGLNLTDYERRAMALLALNINPAKGTAKNYIKEIIKKFDGEQFGDPDLYNDDVFALFPLIHSGYTSSDVEIQKAVNFILSKQKSDGSWDGSDIASAVIQALSLVKDLPSVNEAITKAHNYLFASQKSDGGFDSSFSTSWVMMAIKSLNESPDTWQKNNLNPNDYLANLQALDGGLESMDKDSGMRIWATAYAIPAASNLNWHLILSSFEKSVDENNLNPEKDEKIGKVLGAEKFVFSLFLKQGSHRILAKVNEVIELQKFLNANEYGELAVDGKFGPLTEASLMKFQKDRSLFVDGIVGDKTREEFNK